MRHEARVAKAPSRGMRHEQQKAPSGGLGEKSRTLFMPIVSGVQSILRKKVYNVENYLAEDGKG